MAEERYFVPFLDWLANQQHREDSVGHLARDNADNDDLGGFGDPTSFVQYIGSVGSVEAKEAAIKAAAEYMAWDQSLGA